MIDRSMFARVIRLLSAAAVCLLVVVPGFAQNFSFDARRIGMGGVGDQNNAAMGLAGGARSYRSIPVPLGLFQVLRDPKVFNAGDDEFNPIRALEYLSNPLHVTFDREESESGEKLVQDLVNGRISRDLNSYRGFVPDSSLRARGLLSPNWGKTFRVYDNGDSMFHGVYVGAGPYLSIGTDATFDQNLINILSSSSNMYLPNSSFVIDDTTDGQVAMAITGGYRLRLPVPASSGVSERDGIYVAANYNHLHGLHHETDALRVRFDTDSAGLVTLAPTTTPLVINRESSSTGRGFGIDLATALVLNGFDLSFAANGLGNRIEWEGFEAEQHVLTSLVQGSFTQNQLPAPTGKRRIELPVRYSGRGAYNAASWTVDMEASRTLQGKEFRGGAEYRLGLIELRGGGRYSRSIWNPAGGIGLNLLPGFGIDVAAFGTSTNVERQRKASLAVSLRFGGGDSAN